MRSIHGQNSIFPRFTQRLSILLLVQEELQWSMLYIKSLLG